MLEVSASDPHAAGLVCQPICMIKAIESSVTGDKDAAVGEHN